MFIMECHYLGRPRHFIIFFICFQPSTFWIPSICHYDLGQGTSLQYSECCPWRYNNYIDEKCWLLVHELTQSQNWMRSLCSDCLIKINEGHFEWGVFGPFISHHAGQNFEFFHVIDLIWSAKHCVISILIIFMFIYKNNGYFAERSAWDL